MQFDWKSYFIFTSKEQKGIIVLGCILTFSLCLHYIIPGNQNKKIADRSSVTKPKHYFYFDPNLLDSTAGDQLGFSRKQMTTLYRYRAKGGRFRQKEDLLKWYGLPEDQARQLMPWVRIKSQDREVQKHNQFQSRLSWSQQQIKIDINNPNATEWIRVTGLPAYKVKRILAYQKWSGGFTSLQGLKKVYGITPFDFDMLRPYIIYQPKASKKMSYRSMRFEDWMSLGIFDEKAVWAILKLKKMQQGRLSWSQIVVQFDLTETEANTLKKRTNLSN